MSDGQDQDQATAREFEALLDYLRRSRGFDFTGYKRSSLARRIDKRMQTVGVQGYPNYIDFLEVHPEEFGRLFDTILINVTAFFRDPTAWEALGQEVLPRLAAGKRDDEPIRVWSAGCASGEEAYSLAMSLAEALGVEAARERVKIYATDVDEEALATARHAAYDERQIEAVPEALRARYFEPLGGRFVFHKELRRSVIFGRHDLIQDAPISRVDLLVCRNTLMYFNTDTQARILDRFHFALNERGFLFLGKAETLLTYNNTFAAVDLKRRLFVKVRRAGLRDRLVVTPRARAEETVGHLVSHVRVRDAAFELAPVAQLVIDGDGHLVLINERARALFGLTLGDLGRPLQDLQISYRPVEVRSCIDRATAERVAVVLEAVEWITPQGDPRHLDIHVVPLLEAGGSQVGTCIYFLDITSNQRLKAELEAANRALETAYEELQSTNEELETTNEELQSTVEELETTNEELQSTNEELETMNEELQSTNEELETVNDELRQRSEEFKEVNTYLGSILASIQAGVVVVDADLVVLVWNPKAEDLWGLRAEEVRSKNLLGLDFGLPVDQLRAPIRACIAGDGESHEVTVQALNRRGRAIRCRVTCSPLRDTVAILGAILMMEEAAGHAAAEGSDG
jgi:two-component system, chemotaxis family, CheB/CheR fusion protein